MLSVVRKMALSIGVAVVALGAQVAAAAENRVALVIGQSAYRAVTPLANPGNDAKAMTQLLGDAGFEVQTATDLTQTAMRAAVSDFAGRIAAKGPDTVALVFYAGHGLQIDGENYLVPVDVDPKREADIPLQAVRLNDVMNTLISVPSRMRIVLLDACRNNPFPEISKTAGRGLAIVDAKVSAAGTFLSFSTAPGDEAEDGNGANSPYTTALLTAAREPGVSIEDAFKRARLSVSKATSGRQTPWDSSSLTDDFRFFPGAGDAAVRQKGLRRSLDAWRQELRGKTPEAANDLIVVDGADEAYEAFVELFGTSTFGPQARDWLVRFRRMKAWDAAVVRNTAAGYRAFLTKFPDSDLTVTARKLEDRLRNKPEPIAAAGAVLAPTNVALAPTCPCGPAQQTPALKKKSDPPARRAEPAPKKPVGSRPPPRGPRTPPVYEEDDDVVVIRRPPVIYDVPGVSIGSGSYGRSPGNYGGIGRGRY